MEEAMAEVATRAQAEEELSAQVCVLEALAIHFIFRSYLLIPVGRGGFVSVHGIEIWQHTWVRGPWCSPPVFSSHVTRSTGAIVY